MESQTITTPHSLTTTVVVSQTQMDYQTVTITHTFTKTVVVSQTSNNPSLEQNQGSEGSTLAWMVATILLLLIAFSAIFLSISAGYLLYKKTKSLKTFSKESPKQGTVSFSSIFYKS